MDSWSFELVHQPKPFTMLIGTKFLAKAKELGDVSKSDLARSAGYVSTKKNGMERLNYIALYEALLEANGMHLAAGGWGRRGGLNLPLNQELLKLDLPQVRRILGNGRCILSC